MRKIRHIVQAADVVQLDLLHFHVLAMGLGVTGDNCLLVEVVLNHVEDVSIRVDGRKQHAKLADERFH